MGVKHDTDLFPDEGVEASSLRMTVVSGSAVNVWAAPETVATDKRGELKVELQPHRPVVIGRQQGGEIKYLDPHYQPTQLLPGADRSILASNELDKRVSRGHFMLKASPQGICLVNGVPRRGGGIRPPLNGTILLEPVHRRLDNEEEYLIERGTSAKICLPNSTVILLVPDVE
jgi:hypothetical protein